MKAHFLQHVSFEGLGGIEPWLTAKGYDITATKFFESSVLPSHKEIDFLIIMGGPMSVNDETEYPWLVAEKKFIREVIEAGKSVLGICLGAQLIARAMGSQIYRNEVKEIGWFPVRSSVAPGTEQYAFPESLEVFHWHGETFDLPAGATRLASSAGCKNQAFQLGNSVIGLQFHLETTSQSARDIVAHCLDELVEGQYIQTAEEILAADGEKYLAVNKVMITVLEYLHAKAKFSSTSAK